MKMHQVMIRNRRRSRHRHRLQSLLVQLDSRPHLPQKLLQHRPVVNMMSRDQQGVKLLLNMGVEDAIRRKDHVEHMKVIEKLNICVWPICWEQSKLVTQSLLRFFLQQFWVICL